MRLDGIYFLFIEEEGKRDREGEREIGRGREKKRVLRAKGAGIALVPGGALKLA